MVLLPQTEENPCAFWALLAETHLADAGYTDMAATRVELMQLKLTAVTKAKDVHDLKASFRRLIGQMPDPVWQELASDIAVLSTLADPDTESITAIDQAVAEARGDKLASCVTTIKHWPVGQRLIELAIAAREAKAAA